MSNDPGSRGLLRQEVEELTDLLRRSAEWGDLRQALASRKLEPKDVFLASFHEDEEENEYGVFVTMDRRIFEYKRSTRSNAKPRFAEWLDRTNDDEVMREHPQVIEALAMLSEE